MTTDDDRTTAPFIMVSCVCGRTLRARWEQVGAEIRCWDCQQAVKVHAPRFRRRLAGRLVGSIARVFGSQGTDALGRGAAILTVGLAVPYIGLAVAVGLLAVGAAAYEDLVRAVAEPARPFGVDWRRVRGRLTPARSLACLAFAVGSVLPLWGFGVGVRQPPCLTMPSLAALVLCWSSLPLAIAAGLGERPRDGLALLARHPLATLATLAIVPLFLVATEAILFGLLYATGGLPFFAADLIPMPDRMTVMNGYAYQGSRIYTFFPKSFFVESYLVGLRRGYCFLGTVPPSLSLPILLGVIPSTFYWTTGYYALLRLMLTFLTSLGLVIGFAIQAQCLGVLLHARRLRLA